MIVVGSVVHTSRHSLWVREKFWNAVGIVTRVYAGGNDIEVRFGHDELGHVHQTMWIKDLEEI